MGKRGPTKKPAKLKKLDGAAGATEQEAREPKCTLPPKAPAALPAAARAMWQRLIDVTPPGLYTAMDEVTLAIYCEAHAEIVSLKRRIRRDGQFIKGSTGQLSQHPAYRMIKDRRDLLVKLAAKLGLSPGDRANIGMPPPSEIPHNPDRAPAPETSADSSKAPPTKTTVVPFESLIGRNG